MQARLEGQGKALRQAIALLYEQGARAVSLIAAARARRRALRKSYARRPLGVCLDPDLAGSGAQAPELPHIARDADAEKRPAEKLRPREQSVVDALAWFEMVGVSPVRDVAVGSLSGYRTRSAGWVDLRRRLRRRGLIVHVGGPARLSLTQEGRALATPMEKPSSAEELHSAVLSRLEVPERRILQALVEAHPEALDTAELARRCGDDPRGGSFHLSCGRLRDLGLILTPAPGLLRASDVLLRYGPAPAAAQTVETPLRPRLLRGGLHFEVQRSGVA